MTNSSIIEDLRLIPPPAWWQTPWGIALAVLLTCLFVWLLRRYLSRERVVPIAPAPSGPPPEIEALRRLAELRGRWQSISAYQLAIEVSDILRGYLEPRFKIPVRYQTTREFLDTAAVYPDLLETQRQTLGKFLGFCDQVKFAQLPATVQEQANLLDTAEQVIRGSSEKN